MSINQFIEEQLTGYARRFLQLAGERVSERTRDTIQTVEAYRRAFRTSRAFRQIGG